MYYLGFTYEGAYNIPIALRQHFIERTTKELNRTSEQGNTQTKALHGNTPDTREMQGRMRSQVPSRLRRFT